MTREDLVELMSESDARTLRQFIVNTFDGLGTDAADRIMRAAELLESNPNPSREEIVTHMNTNLCRCGTYPRIIRAIENAARRVRRQDV